MRNIQEVESDINSLKNAISIFNSSISSTESKLVSINELLLNTANGINSEATSAFLYDYLKEANQKLVNKLKTLNYKIDSVSGIVNDKVTTMIGGLYEEKRVIENFNTNNNKDGADGNG